MVSLQFAMNMLPMKWVAMKRSIEFWVQVMRMTDGRLLKVVMLEALEVGCKVRWVKELQQSLVRYIQMEGVRCRGREWVDIERSKAGVEGHSMEGSERSMEGSS